MDERQMARIRQTARQLRAQGLGRASLDVPIDSTGSEGTGHARLSASELRAIEDAGTTVERYLAARDARDRARRGGR